MKILTLNIWNGGRLFAEARKFLQNQKPDIIFIQEAYDGHGQDLEERFRTVEILQSDFPEYDSFFSPLYLDTRVKEGNIEDGQLLLSRWPLEQKQSISLDIPYGAFDQDAQTDFSAFPSVIQTAVVRVANKSLTLVNVHGPVDMDGMNDSPRRQTLQKKILAVIQDPCIVAGDFNARAESKTFQVLESRLQNIFKNQFTTTFNTSRKDLEKFPGYAEAAVDSIFISPSLRVVRSDAPQVDISDHLPLVAELEFVPQ